MPLWYFKAESMEKVRIYLPVIILYNSMLKIRIGMLINARSSSNSEFRHIKETCQILKG